MEQLQSHIWLTASSYMGKYLRISSYIRKPFLINEFATAPLWISWYTVWRNMIFFFISVLYSKDNGDIHNGGGLAWVGDGADGWALHFTQCWLWTHKKYTFQLFDGFLTIHIVHLLFKTGHDRFAMHYFLKNPHNHESKYYESRFWKFTEQCNKYFWNWCYLSWIKAKKLRKYEKNLNFHQYISLMCMFYITRLTTLCLKKG